MRQSVLAYSFRVKATRTGAIAFDPNVPDDFVRAQREVELVRAELDKIGEVRGGAKVTTRNVAATKDGEPLAVPQGEAVRAEMTVTTTNDGYAMTVEPHAAPAGERADMTMTEDGQPIGGVFVIVVPPAPRADATAAPFAMTEIVRHVADRPREFPEPPASLDRRT